MPRLMFAIGVIIVAVIAVARPRRRKPRPVRLPPTSDDPVCDALADARSVSRFPDDPVLDVDDLRWIVSVDELSEYGDFNTAVGLSDEVASYADVYYGLDAALFDQPGIDEVHHMDREAVLVQSMLSLPDVHAATIRALLAINQSPRLPRYRPLPRSVLSTVADGVAATMAVHGFTGRLRMSLEQDEAHIDLRDVPGPGFYRFFADDRLVQVIRLGGGYGNHNSDGTIVDGHLDLIVDVIEIATTYVSESIGLEHGCEVVAGERILSMSSGVAATVDDVARRFVSKALPLCEATTSRVAIVDRWVIDLPWSVPDRTRWDAADIAARWGFRKHARDLVRPWVRRVPQAAAIAAKYQL